MTLTLPAEGSKDWDASLAAVFAAIDARVSALELGNLGSRLSAVETTTAALAPLSKVADASRFGVLGNGVADDTAGLHLARDAAGIGGTVLVPPGTYVVSGLSLSVASQTWHLMPGAVLKAKAGTNPTAVLNVTASGVTIRGGRIDGNRATQATTGNDVRNFGVKLSNVSAVAVRETEIVDCGGYAVYLDRVTNAAIAWCRITNCAYAANTKAITLATTGNSSGVTVAHCTIDSSASGAGGIGLGNTGYTISDVHILNNSIVIGGSASYDTLGVEVWSANVTTAANTDVEISGNYVYCPTAGNHAYGVSLGGVLRGVASGNTVRNCLIASYEAIGSYLTVAANTATSSGSIVVSDNTGTGVGASNITIAGNTITGTTFYALQLDGRLGGLSKVTVSGNTFDGTYIDAQGALTDVAVVGNTFRTTAGGFVFASSCTLTRFDIKGNHIYSGARGIEFASASVSHVSITGNTIVAATFGIYGNAATTTVSVMGNHITGCATAGIRTESGSKWSIVGNTITGNAGWGIIVTSACTGFTVHSNSVYDNTAGQVSNASTSGYAPGGSTGATARSYAGTASDAIFSAAPDSGALVVDSTTNKLWAKIGSAWKSVTLT